MVERAAKNDRVRRCLAGGVVVFLWIVPPQIRALAEDDPLQKAVNYLFTVCVPKIRFGNIGDEGHRELGVT